MSFSSLSKYTQIWWSEGISGTLFDLCVFFCLHRWKNNNCMCAFMCKDCSKGGLFLHVNMFRRHTPNTVTLARARAHTHTQRHLHSHTYRIRSVSVDALCQFNLCSGTFMWDQNRWQLQRGCSASLGCVGVIVGGSRLITCHTLRSPPCLGHCGKLSGRPTVDLMQSHREPSSLHLSDSHRRHAWMETKPPGVVLKPFVS